MQLGRWPGLIGPRADVSMQRCSVPGTAVQLLAAPAVLHDPKTISAPLDRTDYSFVSFLEKGKRGKKKKKIC